MFEGVIEIQLNFSFFSVISYFRNVSASSSKVSPDIALLEWRPVGKSFDDFDSNLMSFLLRTKLMTQVSTLESA